MAGSETVSENDVLLAWWDGERNDVAPGETRVRSYTSVWWCCPDKGHAFERSPASFSKNIECPICSLGEGSLASEYPEIARMWHPTKNVPLQPTDIPPEHGDACHWVCELGHTYARAPRNMLQDSSCPVCARQQDSLLSRYPMLAGQWHPDKNGDITPDKILPTSTALAWWVCHKGHEFQQSVKVRALGQGRCPECYGGWSLPRIREFVRSLLGHLDSLTPSEIFALAMQAGALKNQASYHFTMAVSTGRFPKEELEKFVDGQPSLVDDFATDDTFTLELVDGRIPASPASDEADPYALPDAPSTDTAEGTGELDLELTEAANPTGAREEEERGLPVIETKEALETLDALTANADVETARFLIDSALAKLWRHAYVDAPTAKSQARAFVGGTYANVVQDTFLKQLEQAEQLELPEGYAFRPTPESAIATPHLMQRHVAVCVREKRRFGNWSGMGAGKTLSALLATRVVGADLTVVCCPNAVVGNWAREIKNAFPHCVVRQKTLDPDWGDTLSGAPRYLVLNYEQFQQPESESRLVTFLDHHKVDFIVIDEIHFAKQRSASSMSKRKRLVQGLVVKSGEANDALCVLGMSGTPVINDLREGISLIELITGHRHDDLESKATVQNCMRLYQRFVTLGTRWRPDYETTLSEDNFPEIDVSPMLDEIREVARRKGTVLELEQILTRARIPAILDALTPGQKTLIYTYYVDGIVDQLRDAVIKAGFKVGLYTGQSGDEGLQEFMKEGSGVDVLIASSTVSTGVDGLQRVCNKLIINILPWTRAEYDQLKGRLWRQGSTFETVEVITPITYADVGGERWSYCESKLERIAYKRSIADAAVDGVVPEGNLRSPIQAQQDILDWLDRLEQGELADVVLRPRIEIPLSMAPDKVNQRNLRYGDFSRLNARWYASSSQTTHTRLAQNPEEWAHYHTLYRTSRETWQVVPFEEEIRWLEQREGLVVGDFGCGEAIIAKKVGDRHTIMSFDHVAIDDSVVACDMSKVPLADESLDLAIFSLSLMGTNFTDYIVEARRCLKLDKQIHIWEPRSRFGESFDPFTDGLGKLGFDVFPPETVGRFVYIHAVKNTRQPVSSTLDFGRSKQ